MLFVLLGVNVTAVIAQEKCSDVLKDGTFSSEKRKDNFYLQQIIFSRFLSSTFESSKDTTGLGGTVPLGEIVIGGKYTRDQYNEKKEEITEEYLKQITTSREIDVALTSGDSTIVNAWKSCMTNRGGLSLRFEPVSNTEVFAVVEWFGVAGFNETTLDRTIEPPAGIRISEGADCFKNGKNLVNSLPCRATIIVPDAFTTWAVSLSAERGSVQSFMPARVRSKVETDNYVFDMGSVKPGPNETLIAELDKDNLFTRAYRANVPVSRTVRLTEAQKKAGWSFVPSSAKVILNKRRALDTNGCELTAQEVDSNSFTYGLRVWGRTYGDGARSTATCDVTPFIKMTRTIWVPYYG